MMILRALLLALAIANVTPALAQSFLYECPASNTVVGPAHNPVWVFCWTSPDQSSGPDGSGIELRWVHYRGKLFVWRLNLPVLNVVYETDSTGCGPTYRHGTKSLAGFDNTTTPATTTCETPGSDPGTFQGVTVQTLVDIDGRESLVLTTQTQAGGERYVQRIMFHPDGRIVPSVAFTAVPDLCVDKPHTHHGYYRFNFGALTEDGTGIWERRKVLWWWLWSKQTIERTRNRVAGRRWRWGSAGRLVEVQPGPRDGDPPNTWAGSDVWLLRGHVLLEMHDGGRTSGTMADAQHIDGFVNGEIVDGTDIALWYRVSQRHETGLGCVLIGPTLKAVNW